MAALASNSDRNRAKVTIIVTTLILLVGLILALVAMQSQTLIFNRASTSTGVAEISLSPSSSSVPVGDTFSVDVMIDTQGKVISGASVLINYVTGDEYPLKIVKVEKSVALQGGDWIYPVMKPGAEGSTQPNEIQIAALFVSPSGFSSDTAFSIATITFEGQDAGTVQLNFDVTETKITEKSTAQDILLTPSSQGNYTVTGGGSTPTVTATPTQGANGSASIDLEKTTNGYDADQSPGPRLNVGDSVTWRYVVTNNGDQRLTEVVVEDDREGVITCPLETLNVGQDMTCTKYGTVGRGQYSNSATVTANTPDDEEISDTDASHYYGEGESSSGTTPTPTSPPTPTISSLPQAGNETPLVIAGGIGLMLILAAGAVLLL